MRIKNLAICLICRNNEILVLEGLNHKNNEIFYRPLGGHIEFSETAKSAIFRELKEEVGTEIENIKHLATFESIFEYNGIPEHEILILFSASFKHKSFYLKDIIECKEGDDTFIAKWINIDEFISGNKTLYPDGLSKYLKNRQQK